MGEKVNYCVNKRVSTKSFYVALSVLDKHGCWSGCTQTVVKYLVSDKRPVIRAIQHGQLSYHFREADDCGDSGLSLLSHCWQKVLWIWSHSHTCDTPKSTHSSNTESALVTHQILSTSLSEIFELEPKVKFLCKLRVAPIVGLYHQITKTMWGNIHNKETSQFFNHWRLMEIETCSDKK